MPRRNASWTTRSGSFAKTSFFLEKKGRQSLRIVARTLGCVEYKQPGRFQIDLFNLARSKLIVGFARSSASGGYSSDAVWTSLYLFGYPREKLKSAVDWPIEQSQGSFHLIPRSRKKKRWSQTSESMFQYSMQCPGWSPRWVREKLHRIIAQRLHSSVSRSRSSLAKPET